MSNASVMVQIESFRDQRRTAEQAMAQAKRSRTIGLGGVLVGLILSITPAFPLGLLLLLAGIMAALNQFLKGDHQKKLIAYYDQEIEKLRVQLV